MIFLLVFFFFTNLFLGFDDLKPNCFDFRNNILAISGFTSFTADPRSTTDFYQIEESDITHLTRKKIDPEFDDNVNGIGRVLMTSKMEVYCMLGEAVMVYNIKELTYVEEVDLLKRVTSEGNDFFLDVDFANGYLILIDNICQNAALIRSPSAPS